MDDSADDVLRKTIDIEDLKETSKLTRKAKIIIGSVSGGVVAALAIILPCVLILGKKNEDKPIPPEDDLYFTEEGHRKLSRQFATEGTVLAVNNGLPLKSNDQVVLFGDGTNDTIYGGTGSGEVYAKGSMFNIKPIQVLEGIENKYKEKKFLYKANNKGYEIKNGSNLTEADIAEFAKKGKKAKRSVAIITISRISSEAMDRQQDQSLHGTLLKDSEKETYNLLIKYFDHVVVVLNVGSVMELEGWETDPKTSVVIPYLPGMEAGNAIADVLTGDRYPAGHLVDTWAKKISDYSTTETFLESKIYVKYKEGLFVGYRYFEEYALDKVVFPFGYGLSYTNFSITLVEAKVSEGIVTIVADVKNIGSKPGKEAVQIYVEKPQNEKFIKAIRELCAFAKTKELKGGETQTLTMNIAIKDLASYDDEGVTGHKACYVLEAGDYNFYMGANVKETRDAKSKVFTYKQTELKVTEQLKTRLVPKDEDVRYSNVRPNFTEIMSKKNITPVSSIEQEEAYRLEKENTEKLIGDYINSQKNNDYFSYQPTDKINEINFKTVLEKKYTMEQLVDTMSNEELAYLSHGRLFKIRMSAGSIGGHYNAGPLGKYLIPNGDTLDGPAGLRMTENSLGAVAWPCSTSLASTFDLDILKKVGEETGKELRKINGTFWLAPGMNIHRNPLCGRNFEYYSEDPFLTGKLASAITKGLQSKNVSITLKHFAFNNKEYNRKGLADLINGLASDSRMSERVAREIYLKGFEIAVKEGKAWSIMSSYNRMNGAQTAENYDLCTGILREEWGFDGLLMTDWVANSHHDREAHAGNDVKMPINFFGVKTIMDGLVAGTVTRKDLKRNAVHILNTFSKTAAVDRLFTNKGVVNIAKGGKTKINLYDNFYDRAPALYYIESTDDKSEGKYMLAPTITNSWVTILINNPEERKMRVRVRYCAPFYGFGVIFKKYGVTLGELNNLNPTSGFTDWTTSNEGTIELPKGTYELTVMFTGYDYKPNIFLIKGAVNWIEIF